MNKPPPMLQSNPLLMERIVWLAIMMGQVVFLVLVLFVLLPQQKSTQPVPLLPWVDLGALVVVVPVALIIRHLMRRRRQYDQRAAERSHLASNIVFWAACEMVVFTGLIAIMMSHSIRPTIFYVVLAMALQAITFPTTGPMIDSD